MAVVAQGELVGDPFARNFKLHRRSENVPFPQQRQVRIAAALDEETGLMNFTPAKLAPIAVSLLHHEPLTHNVTVFDYAFQKPSLTTARKRGASTSGVNMDETYQSRGGDPDYRPLKTKGFAYSSTAKEVAKAREIKKQQAKKRIFYQSHP